MCQDIKKKPKKIKKYNESGYKISEVIKKLQEFQESTNNCMITKMSITIHGVTPDNVPCGVKTKIGSSVKYV